MAEPAKLKFHFIKSNGYRVIHADGMYGGITPRGGIFASVYNERPPIPEFTVNEITNTGLGPEIQRGSKDGIVREVEVGLLMSLETAESFHVWLGDKIKESKDLMKRVKGAEIR